MMTVVDHVSPWLMPRRTLAKMIQPQLGPNIKMSGTGTPMIQPATRTGLRPTRSERVPAKKLVAAFTTPNATMNVSVAVNAVMPKTWSARRGRTVRSWPIIPPTSALMPTRRQNWPRFSRNPSRTIRESLVVVTVRSGANARLREPSRRGRRSRCTRPGDRAAVRMLAAVAARSPCPHITVIGPEISSATSAREPSSMLRAPGI